MHLHETLQKIKSRGYYPVLAHPERYQYMGDREYARLKEMGIKFQLNLPSLAGMYGPEVQQKAENLLKKNYYNLMGTDTHRLKQITFCSNTKIKMKRIHLLEQIYY